MPTAITVTPISATASGELKRAIEANEFKRVNVHGTVLARIRIQREYWRKAAFVIDGKARWDYEHPERVVFSGAASGEHSIDLTASSVERVRAHWAGYLETNRIRMVPVVGEFVTFPSGSHPSGFRHGRVTKVGPRRTTIEFRYKHGGRGVRVLPHYEVGFNA